MTALEKQLLDALRKAWILLDVAEPNADITEEIFALLSTPHELFHVLDVGPNTATLQFLYEWDTD